MKSELNHICEYRKGKVDVGTLDETTYISTENMLPNKAGIEKASSLPTTPTTQEYCKGDVLVSNIRPYFKKIWKAKCDGGCSADVLVFSPKEDVDSDYLYYVLSDDAFFDYSMATSKGTKMPRGDKDSIMKFVVPDFYLITQKKIASILRSLDEKIELNNKINNNLLEQAQAVYQQMFIDNLSNEWKNGTLSDIAKISSGKRPQIKSLIKFDNNNIPLVGATSVMGFTNKANYNEKILVIGRVGTHGVIQRFNSPCWASDNTLVITSDYYEYTSQILQKIDYSSLNRGSTQPLITQGDINNIPIIIPDNITLLKFEEIVGILMAKFENNLMENAKLSELRDTLLPKLMSGELDVSNIDI